MKTFEIKAGERARVLQRFSNSLQASYGFDVEPMVPGQEVSGTVEVKGSNWIFPKPITTQQLAASNSVEKGMWDTFYSVYVIPNIDVRVKTTGVQSSKMWLYLLIAAAVIGIAVVPIILSSG